MTTIKIGNEEVELEAAKATEMALRTLNEEPEVAPMPPAVRNYLNALAAAIKEAEEVEGPFGMDRVALTFRGAVVKDDDGHGIPTVSGEPAVLNRILSQHFVSKDELRAVLRENQAQYAVAAGGHANLRCHISALIEKGQNDDAELAGER